MKLAPKKREETSATLAPTLWVIAGLSLVFALAASASDPAWWSSRGAVVSEQVITNSGVVTTNYVPNPYAVVTQGQLKLFTSKAVAELNADLSGGAGTNLNTLVSNWAQDYATNGYATNTASPTYPYNPSDFTAMTVGQLKYIASLIDGQLTNAGYLGLYPSWIQVNTNTDNVAANLGQLKEVFDFDLSTAPAAVSNLTASPTVDGIALAWTLPANNNNATSLVLEESTDGGTTWTVVANLSPTSTSYLVSGLDPNTSYEFEVASANPVNSGEIGSGSGAGGGSTSSSTPSAPPLPLPPRYAVIDLGVDVSPNAISGTNIPPGATSVNTYIVETGADLGIYRWCNGVREAQPLQDGGWTDLGPTSIDDSGTVPGIGLNANFNIAFDNATAMVWPVGSSNPTPLDATPLTPGPLAYLTQSQQPNVIDYNGTIYGTDNEAASVEANKSTDGEADYTIEYSYTLPFLGVEWTNYSAHVTELGSFSLVPSFTYPWSPYLIAYQQSYGSNNEIVYIAKNNQTAGYLYPYPSSGIMINTVNHVPVSYYPQDINTAGWTIGRNGSSAPFSYSVYPYGSSTPQTIPGAVSLFCLNHHTRNLNTNGISTPVECPQIVGSDSSGDDTLYQQDPNTGAFEAHHIDELMGASSGWSGFVIGFGFSSPYSYSINDAGAIVGTATYSGTNTSIAAGSHGVLLLPIQLRVTTRDDPTATWASNVLQNGVVPVYGGQNNGDMVSWTFAGISSWTGATFAWSVTDSNGNPVVDQNGVTITGPSGTGVSSWTIATWSAGGNDPNNQWLTWKPGTYNITCTINGTTSTTFQQVVGQRDKDVLVIAWINPAGVPLSTSGVNSEVTSTLPSSGTFAGPIAKTAASIFLANVSTGSTALPSADGYMTSTDETYVLDWMFKYAANSAPPTSFANEAAVDTFVSTPTNYKLINRLQIKWLLGASGQFQSPPTQIQDGTSYAIGTTVDPIWGSLYPGAAGPANGRIRITGNVSYHQMNDGTPDFWAVSAFNTLMSPLEWSDIGSRIDEGIPLDSGTPPVTGYSLENQVYPTYSVYTRNADGSFTQVNTIPQASSPTGNFSSSPYPPDPVLWVLP